MSRRKRELEEEEKKGQEQEQEQKKEREGKELVREVHPALSAIARQGRGWCDDSFGVFCLLFNVLKGNTQGIQLSQRIDNKEV